MPFEEERQEHGDGPLVQIVDEVTEREEGDAG
jgi:hypothetical protein